MPTEALDVTKAFGEALVELGEKNPRIVIVEADLADSCKSDLFRDRFPERTIDVGVAEATAVAVGARLAFSGKIPYVNTFAVYAAARVFDQVRQLVAYGRANVKICGSAAGLSLGYAGASHHALEDIALMGNNPTTKSGSKKEWLETTKKMKTTGMKFTTLSGEEMEILYSPEDVKGIDYSRDIGFPGEFPYTRGIHQNMYRGRIWTMRQFAGFGTPEDTNRRFKYLLEHGQTGLSTAFDLPTLMGWDSDAELSAGEVGICGVSVSSLEDMKILFDGIPLDQVSTSMTINSPAAMIFAFYLAVAELQGAGPRSTSATTSSV